ncbi:MAG: redox-active disulfide protein 2 [Firmicutes bacterium GWF2_51_9]|nr:TM0996/MTH895 family glutaredoxin-like protein [Erysipelotrichaceae bacterium]OGS54348.1 MAG: redox-active disulfide protein 2 [Firmicutes bacterium GWF2_51_9]OGS59705.1 MAG: redox-active disulfide protein 2 [Firmicutes bacterium GWE2_51_13]HAM64081.1 redox-active disulfide protein 2 [Erysipelotrichaceae bacterium]HAO61686.1 redox-active disulfide protein 2 [Erysipelotrichaceae bacterium]
MILKILGKGCPNCQRLEANVREAANNLGLEATIEKVTDVKTIVGYGVMSTPALVKDEKVVSYGRVLSVKEAENLLK